MQVYNDEGEPIMKDKIVNFFREVIKEMEKVTWPSWDELMESTKVVVIVTLIISFFTWLVDLAVSEILKAIF